MSVKSRINYWKRVFQAYRSGANSQLTFWHEKPTINEKTDFKDPASGYYMTFYDKTLYPGPFDENGVPLLDYKGVIGKQYNPIAIAQYGLGFYNGYVKENEEECLSKFLNQCELMYEKMDEKGEMNNIWILNYYAITRIYQEEHKGLLK